jgi:hypothetical protein
MSYTTEDIIVFVACVCMDLLSFTPEPQKDPAYADILPSRDVLEDILTNAGITFAEGLLGIVESNTAPSISYFKTLDIHATKMWAIYVLVLEKSGQRPKLYFGCCTEKRSGVSTRLGQYRRRENLPRFVKLALKDGFQITPTGFLCWVPLPDAADRFKLRVAMLLLEAMFSLYFWAMVSRTWNYDTRPICPWPLDSIEYDGCCGHVPLKEHIHEARANMTAEQLNTMDAVRKTKNSRRDQATRGKVRMAVDAKNNRARAKVAKKYFCSHCNINFGAGNQLRNHKLTEKHLNAVAGIVKPAKNPRAKERHDENLATNRYYCSSCKYPAKTQQKLTAHLQTKKHLKQVGELSS